MTIHPLDCTCTTSIGCRIRRERSLVLDAGAARSTPRHGKPGTNAEHNGWERGIAGEQRANGTFMPYLKPNASGTLEKVGVKQHAQYRAHHEETRRKQHDVAVSAGHHH